MRIEDKDYIKPISDTGDVSVSATEQRHRGWHDYKRVLEFSLVTLGQVYAFVSGLKEKDKGFDMWFSADIEALEGKFRVTIKHGYDSGD